MAQKMWKKYQLMRDGNEFVVGHKKEIRSAILLEESLVEEFNSNAPQSGKYYELDEEAQLEYEFKEQAKKEAKEKKINTNTNKTTKND